MFYVVLSVVLHVMEESLELTEHFMAELSQTVINESKDGYPELDEKKGIHL